VVNVARDERAPVLQGRRGDNEVGIAPRVAALVGRDPEVGGAVQKVVADRDDERVLAERLEALQLGVPSSA
jgi:hypothetical protein